MAIATRLDDALVGTVPVRSAASDVGSAVKLTTIDGSTTSAAADVSFAVRLPTIDDSPACVAADASPAVKLAAIVNPSTSVAANVTIPTDAIHSGIVFVDTARCSVRAGAAC